MSPAEVDELLDIVRGASATSTAILNSVLSLAAIESVGFTLVKAPTALAAVAGQVAFQMRSWAAAEHVRLRLEVDPALPELVLADGPRLSQVLTNFLSNALKHCPQDGSGEIVLALRLMALQQPVQQAVSANGLMNDDQENLKKATVGAEDTGSSDTGKSQRQPLQPSDAKAPANSTSSTSSGLVALVRVECRDNGPGIPPAAQAQLFRPFVQLDSHGRPCQDSGGGGARERAGSLTTLTSCSRSTEDPTAASAFDVNGSNGSSSASGEEASLHDTASSSLASAPPDNRSNNNPRNHKHTTRSNYSGSSSDGGALSSNSNGYRDTAAAATTTITTTFHPIPSSAIGTPAADGLLSSSAASAASPSTTNASSKADAYYSREPTLAALHHEVTSQLRPPESSGLGLSIAKEICVQHGGRIGVDSAPGQGATFWAELPLPVVEPPPPPAAQAPHPAAAGSVSVPWNAVQNAGAAKGMLTPRSATASYNNAYAAASDSVDATPSVGGGGAGLAPLNHPRRRESSVSSLASSQASDHAAQGSPPVLHRAAISDITGGGGGSDVSGGCGTTSLTSLPAAAAEAANSSSGSVTGAADPTAVGAHQRIPTAAAAATSSAAVVSEASVTGGGGLRVLIVDDVASNRKLMARVMRAKLRDCVTDEVGNGAQAVALVEASHRPGGTPYDLCLLDAQMPVMTGYEAARRIRQLEGDGSGANSAEPAAAPLLQQHHLPIIGVTGNALDEDQRAFMAAGVDDVVIKPVTGPRLFSSIEAQLRKRSAGGATSSGASTTCREPG